MSKQLLFYETVTPISTARHSKWAVTTEGRYKFAAESNAVPLMAVEFISAAHEFPIVFSAEGDNILPIAVMGLDANKSLFVGPDGTWGSSYIPAFIRRYPFVFSGSEDSKTLTLCIDESFEGLDRKGKKGQRLFDEAGKKTPYLESMLQFTNAFQGEHQRTRQFSSIIKSLDILEPSQAKLTLPDGTSRALTGFQCVSRAKLKEVKAEKLAGLFANDALELIYLHLYSLRNFDELVRKMTAAAAAA